MNEHLNKTRLPFENSKQQTIAKRVDDIIENLAINSLEQTLQQVVEIFSINSIDEDQMVFFQSKVAFLFKCLMENWQKHGKSFTELKNKINCFFSSKDKLPTFWQYERSKKLGKRQPAILESINGTLERFEMMEKIQNIFKKPCKGIIVGGSLSYGPFYNIRSKQNNSGSSDIDAIFILDPKSIDQDWEDFLDCPYFSESDKQKFISRKNIFLKSLHPTGQANVLSQKFDLQGADYEISIHFFTDEALDEMLSKDISEEIKDTDKVVILKDYKSKKFPHSVCPQTNFEGTPYNYVVPEQTITDEGFITELPAYIIQDHKFHPGIYQNLALPIFSIFYDKDGEITDKLSKFKQSVIAYIKQNYNEKDTEQTILKAHIRNQIFPVTLGEEIKP